MNNLAIAFEIMGKGMGGIFVAIIIIMLAVMALGRSPGARRTSKPLRGICIHA